MAAGDTQDVIFAEVAALGGGNLGAIKRLRYNTIIADSLYNNSFKFDTVPAIKLKPTRIKLREYYGSIYINWQDNEMNNIVETYEQDGYKFQGYNVYQAHSDLLYPWVTEKIATFDKIDGIIKLYGTMMNPKTGYPEYGIQQNGSDSGIKRDYNVEMDHISSTNLIPGKKYYFTLNAYYYNPDPDLDQKNIEGTVGYAEILFQENINGPHGGDYISISHSSGNGEMDINISVVDPFELTGHDYKIYFTQNDRSDILWNLRDETTGTLLFGDQDGLLNDKITASTEGFQLDMFPQYLDMERISMISNGGGPIQTGGGFDITPPPPYPAISADWYRDVLLSGSGGALYLNEPMQINGGHFFCVAGPPTVRSHELAIQQWSNSKENFLRLWNNKYTIKFTEDGGKGWMAFTTKNLVDVPFELWFLDETLEDTTDDVRMMPWIMDDNENDTMDFKLDHRASERDDDPYSDWIFFMMPEEKASPGEEAYFNAVARSNPGYDGSLEVEHISNFVLMNYDRRQYESSLYASDGPENALPDVGTTFLIEFPMSVQPGVDVFTFSTERIDTMQYFREYELHQNYPNPFNASTTIEYKIVESGRVQIQVYDILGQKVETLIDREMDVGRYYLQFDATDYASGIYLYNIRSNNFVETKKMLLLK